MAFNNRNNTTRNKINTTTRLIQLYNDNAGEDSSTVTFGLWNNYATININPMLPKSEQVDGKIFNYEQTASTLLSVDDLVQIQTGIKLLERDDKAEKEGKARKVNSIAIRNQNIVVKIGGAGEYDGIESKYLALFSIDENDNINGNAFYIFDSPKNGLMLNYNEDDNSFKNRNINTQWEEFKCFVDYCVRNLLDGGAHGANKTINYQCSKLGNLLETTKALIENIISGKGNGTSSGGVSRANTSGFGGGSRRRRSSAITLSNEDIEDDDDDIENLDTFTNFDAPDDDDDEIVETKKTTSKKSTKKSSSKKSSKKSKKISVDDIAADMDEDELDDMSDID